MARAAVVAGRVERLLGTAVVATTPVAGGDICTATRVRLSTGSSVLVKTRPHAPPDFFAAEARGLEWLGAAGAAPVPRVLAVAEDCLVIEWVEPGRPSAEAAEHFGRALAATHAAGAVFGATWGDGYVGALPMSNRAADTWPDFYAGRRVQPYLRAARDHGGIAAADADAVDRVLDRIDDLAGPAEPPARLHGDLWSGNLVWGQDGAVHLVDPAAYGGHRETDLAMLALFGCPDLPRVLDAYQDSSPLADGWEDRVPLHQLFPLLVHACLFGQGSGGTGYGARAGDAARRLL